MPEILKPDYSNGLWASGGAQVTPSSTKVQTGWTAEVPPFQWENYLQYRQDQGIAHILQHGISTWDSVTEYQASKSYVQGSDGVIYKAIQTNTNQNPVTDTSLTYWTRFFNSGTLLNIQIITASGTVTKTPGTTRWEVIQVGGGGQGGGTAATNTTQVATGGGGSAGAYAEALFDVSAITTASAVIGLGGSTGAAGANGVAGGTTTLTIGTNNLTTPGGPGGIAGAATSSLPNEGGVAGAFSTAPSHVGALKFIGTPGGGATSGVNLSLASAQPGVGGSSKFGYSRASALSSNAVGYGAGGSGARSLVSTGANNGPSGTQGFIIIKEYA